MVGLPYLAEYLNSLQNTHDQVPGNTELGYLGTKPKNVLKSVPSSFGLPEAEALAGRWGWEWVCRKGCSPPAPSSHKQCPAEQTAWFPFRGQQKGLRMVFRVPQIPFPSSAQMPAQVSSPGLAGGVEEPENLQARGKSQILEPCRDPAGG